MIAFFIDSFIKCIKIHAILHIIINHKTKDIDRTLPMWFVHSRLLPEKSNGILDKLEHTPP